MEPNRWLDWLDARIGDCLEGVISRHHRRRFARLGWAETLTAAPEHAEWSGRGPVRTGNQLDVLVDGDEALSAMEQAILGAQESVHIACWHASPDFRLTREPGSLPLRDLLASLADRLPVRVLLWAGPPLPAFQPTRRMVKAVRTEFVRDSAVDCRLDKRERTMHCHHEKIIVVDGRVAFVGGIDLTALQGDRHDRCGHPPRQPLGWHDAAVRLEGPAVSDVAEHFRQRWQAVSGERLAAPANRPPSGRSDVQVVRTVPEGTYEFAQHGDFTILDAYLNALRSAQSFIYLENQFLWSPEVVSALLDKLDQPPSADFRILLLLPSKPNNGADTTRGQLGRLLDADAGDGRILATTIRGHAGASTAPVYVHAKIGIVDDRWLTIGSANLNEHSLFNDTELNVVTCDRELVHRTRLRLWAEHTRTPTDTLAEQPVRDVIDGTWRRIAEDQARRHRAGLTPTHALTLLPRMSRRAARLQGPMRGLLVDA
jgi:phosphatidylserine/phosphatidylglycerophosphate/cardiolipin synthase-like enzyme